jgi:hypothetical protein
MRVTRQQVLDTPLKTKEIDVPEWGGEILIGEWPVERTGEIMHLFGAKNDPATNPEYLVYLLIMGCLDPVFSSEDVEALQKQSGAVVLRVAQEIMRFNGMTQEALDDARGKS